MKRLLVFGTDKNLARFYYAAHLRYPTVFHAYRQRNIACYRCTEEDYPGILALAEKLKLNHETLAPINKYRRLKELIQETYTPGQHFKTDDILELTGYSRGTAGHLLAKLVSHGYIESHGRTTGHYYCLPSSQPKGRPAPSEPKETCP